MGKFYQAVEGLHDVAKVRTKRPEAMTRPSLHKSQEGVMTVPRPTSIRSAAEWYEDVKTNLLTRHTNGSVKTILFTATAHGDGCSTTAINLARSLAKDGQFKVLLVDANLRTPGLHKVFDINQALSLSDLLEGNNRAARQIKRVGPANLYVLPCNGNRSLPTSLLESKRFGQILKIMGEKFDYVIVDGPPVLSFPESRVLGAKADGVVLVIASGKTRRQVALRAKKQLEEAGGKVLGVVLNKRKFFIPEWVYSRL